MTGNKIVPTLTIVTTTAPASDSFNLDTGDEDADPEKEPCGGSSQTEDGYFCLFEARNWSVSSETFNTARMEEKVDYPCHADSKGAPQHGFAQ